MLEGIPTCAVRLLFSFEGDQLTLVSQQFVEITLPRSDSFEESEAQQGIWYELRDEHDRPLYRKVMDQPTREGVEVFSDDPNQHSIARQAAPNRERILMVLVPDTTEGQTVTVFSRSSWFPLAQQPAKIIGRFALKK